MAHSKNFSKPIPGCCYLLRVGGYLKTFQVSFVSCHDYVHGQFVSGFHGLKTFTLDEFKSYLY
jgi:hypothetical protein